MNGQSEVEDLLFELLLFGARQIIQQTSEQEFIPTAGRCCRVCRLPASKPILFFTGFET